MQFGSGRAAGGRITIAAAFVAAVATSVAAGGPPVAALDAAAQSCEPTPSDAPADSPAVSPPLANFETVAPVRLVDTRDGTGGVDEPVAAGCTLRLDLDAAGVSVDATAVAFSTTVIAELAGFVTVFPCAAGRPPTSNLNARPSRVPTPNLVVALPDGDRTVCFYSQRQADLVIDLNGWWTDDGPHRFTSIAPVRVHDSRVDGDGSKVPRETGREIVIAGAVPPDATSVVANLTVAAPDANGYLVAYPCGSETPLASNLNFVAGESRAVAAIVGLGTGGRLCVWSNTDTHVMVDLAGFYSPAPQFGPAAALRPQQGVRLVDSREPGANWSGKLTAGEVRRLRPVDDQPIATQATAVVLNVIAVQAEAPGFVTAYPCDDTRPIVSAVNYVPNGQSTNLVTVDLSSEGDICFFSLAPVHLIVDLFGVFAAPDDVLAERLSADRFTWPAYTPTGTDYAVECGPETDVVELELDLLRSTRARVNGVPVTAGSIDLELGPDDLISVELRRGSTVHEHWFRCVPDGFPRLDVERPGEPGPGWYLTNLTAQPDGDAFVVILDDRGAPVWYRRADQPLIDVQRRSDGRLYATALTGRTFGIDPERGYRIMSLSGVLVDELTTVSDPLDPNTVYPTDHHEYVELVDGGRALLTYPLLRDQDLTVIGSDYFVDDTVADGVIQEIDADDGLIWSWRASDHFGYDEVTFPQRFALYPNEPNGGEVDTFHLNSLDRVDDGSGDYVVSARHLDAVFRVDRAAGDVVWILGSLPSDAPQRTGATRLEIVGDPLAGPRRPHDARLVGDVLSLFDNRAATGEPARAVAYRIDTTAATATLLWQIDEPLGRSSPGLGSARAGGDGSVLVDWGGGLQPMFEEYDAVGEVVLRIAQVGGGRSYRIVKEPIEAFSVELLRATAGGELETP